MGFGFRLFTATLHEQMRITKAPWITPEFAYPKHLLKVGSSLRQEPSTVDGTWPIPHPAGLSLRDVDSLVGPMSALMVKDEMVGRVDSITCATPQRVNIAMTVGRVGSFDRAMGQRDDSLKDRAAGREYRAILVIPPDASSGLIAIETIGRTAPNAEMVKLLMLGSKYRSLVTTRPWWRMVINQVADRDRLVEVLAENEASVVLTKSGPDGSGDQVKKELRLEASLRAQQIGSLHAWLGLPVPERKLKGISGMLELFGGEDTLDDVGFNDGFVRVGSGTASTKVRLADEVDKFTYPINENVRPDKHAWEQAVRARMRIVRPDLDW